MFYEKYLCVFCTQFTLALGNKTTQFWNKFEKYKKKFTKGKLSMWKN